MSIATGVGTVLIVWGVLGGMWVLGLMLALRERKTDGIGFDMIFADPTLRPPAVPYAAAVTYQDEEETRRTQGRTLGWVLLGAFVIWFGGQVLYTSARATVWQRQTGGALKDFTLGPIENLVVPTASSVVTCIGVFVALALAPGRMIDVVGLTARHARRAAGPALVGFLILLPTVFATGTLSEWLYRLFHVSHPAKHQLLIRITAPDADATIRTLVLIAAGVAAPVFEELLFRGVLQGCLTKLIGKPLVGIVVAGGVFMFLHEPWTYPSIFVIGMLCGVAYDRTKNLFVPILMHALFNATSLAMTLLGFS